jgi:hypothetical protein
MNTAAKIELVLANARKGLYGTPEKPNRGNLGKGVFWLCYFGQRKASEYRNTTTYHAAKAGELYRKEIDNH